MHAVECPDVEVLNPILTVNVVESCPLTERDTKNTMLVQTGKSRLPFEQVIAISRGHAGKPSQVFLVDAPKRSAHGSLRRDNDRNQRRLSAVR